MGPIAEKTSKFEPFMIESNIEGANVIRVRYIAPKLRRIALEHVSDGRILRGWYPTRGK